MSKPRFYIVPPAPKNEPSSKMTESKKPLTLITDPLAPECVYFNQVHEGLVAHYPRKFLIIKITNNTHAGRVHGAFDTEMEAIEEAERLFGAGPVLIRQTDIRRMKLRFDTPFGDRSIHGRPGFW